MQARDVVLLDNALDDLRAIRWEVYRASKSKRVADNYLKRIRNRLRHLDFTAEACTRYITAKGTETPYRFTPVEHYVAFFLIEDGVVKIDRILHSRRDFDKELR